MIQTEWNKKIEFINKMESYSLLQIPSAAMLLHSKDNSEIIISSLKLAKISLLLEFLSAAW